MSFHDTADVLDMILTENPFLDVVQLQFNCIDYEDERNQGRLCYEVAKKHGKPVIVMEPLRGGAILNMPERAKALFDTLKDGSPVSYAMRFAASFDNVCMVLSGMSTLEMVEENVAYMKDFVPLTEAEKDACFTVAQIINGQTAIGCTACHYCTDGCPMHICIPEYFSLYNEDMRDDLEHKGWTINFTNYDKLAEEFGRASECIGCGQCESMCPQHLPIIETLEQVAAHFEN
jgi:predicted aldo/keto reductase-like oxidoreductase